MSVNSRFDGHIVQGHVDEVAVCTEVKETDGSWKYVFKHSKNNITVEKGSITINGVSLTVVDSTENSFSVAIIPYTYNNTNFNQINVGTKVNLEFDIIGKYISKMINKTGDENIPHLNLNDFLSGDSKTKNEFIEQLGRDLVK